MLVTRPSPPTVICGTIVSAPYTPLVTPLANTLANTCVFAPFNAKPTVPTLLSNVSNCWALFRIDDAPAPIYKPVVLPTETLAVILLVLNYRAEYLRSFLGWNIDVNLL